MLYAESSGNVMEKVWIAVKDARTRHDHKAVDGTRLDIQKPFELINELEENKLILHKSRQV
jgi:tRNA A58 N-methylase Trm61